MLLGFGQGIRNGLKGLLLPTYKELSSQAPLQHLPLPPQLILPCSTSPKEEAEIRVKEGERVLKGQLLALGSVALHAPTSGYITAIKPLPATHPAGLAEPCIVLRVDGVDEWCSRHPIADPSALAMDEIWQRIENAGLVGLGGAAFPTATKLRGGHRHRIDTVIINAAECEPYISCDDSLIRNRASEIIKGAVFLQRLLGIRRILVAIEDNKKAAAAAIERAVAAQQAPLSVHSLPAMYPSGSEKLLIRMLLHRELPSGVLPLELGLLCLNVATVYSLYQAVYLDQPLINRVVTVTGAVVSPQNFVVPLGSPCDWLVKHAGGYRVEQPRLIMGGPMMGALLPSGTAPVTKACNCLLVLPPLQQEQKAEQPCIRCDACMEHCPVNLMPQQLYWYARSRQFDRAESFRLFDCIECGCCAYVCPSHIPLVQYYRFAKGEVRDARETKVRADHARARYESRLQRLADLEEQRKQRLALRRKALEKKQSPADQAIIATALKKSREQQTGS